MKFDCWVEICSNLTVLMKISSWLIDFDTIENANFDSTTTQNTVEISTKRMNFLIEIKKSFNEIWLDEKTKKTKTKSALRVWNRVIRFCFKRIFFFNRLIFWRRFFFWKRSIRTFNIALRFMMRISFIENLRNSFFWYARRVWRKIWKRINDIESDMSNRKSKKKNIWKKILTNRSTRYCNVCKTNVDWFRTYQLQWSWSKNDDILWDDAWVNEKLQQSKSRFTYQLERMWNFQDQRLSDRWIRALWKLCREKRDEMIDVFDTIH